MCASTKYNVTNDPDGVIVGDCERLEGGTKLPATPGFVLTVENQSDPLWRDDDLTLITEDNEDTIILDIV
jgi:hypothetical protein